ncbi:hypothetical protein [Actinomycetospora soli]|uniref:hypothetical protein n=1 Tax=Actinomycetospora soli TaxID=2893887 RepID=UPI001E335571|nr:hypothetical protein [Actinomycetospora soli]MCD2187870.1 hypothetical protein [Actinomycetospora soli]
MTKTEALDFIRGFGLRRAEDGDEFVESEFTPGRFFYVTGQAHAAIVIWGDEDQWTFSTIAAARLNMRPTLELYRYVARWRSTSGLGAPYVIEDGGAAVLCETTIGGRSLYQESTAWRVMVTAIDTVSDTARILGEDLAGADGVPLTARDQVGLALLLGWWEITDPRVSRLMGLT